MGPMDMGKMGPTDQFIRHGIFHRADRVYGIPSLPTRERREYELCKRHLWCGYTCERGLVVRLWKEDIWGTGEGGH